LAERSSKALVGPRVAVLAADVSEALGEAAQRVGIGVGAPVRQFPSKVVAEVVVVPFAAAEADEPQRAVEMTAGVEVVERRQELAAREVAGHVEDRETARSV